MGDDIPAVAGVPRGAAVDLKYEDVGGETTLVITPSLGPFIIQRRTSLETERGHNQTILLLSERGQNVATFDNNE